MTLTDLHSLTFDTLLPTFIETRGVAKNKGISYRTANYTATDAAGQEHEYKVRVSSKGERTIKDLGLTRAQHERNVQAQYDALKPATKRALAALEMPFSNLMQQVIVGEVIEGRPQLLSLRAVLGAGTRAERVRELFPGVDTLQSAISALQAFAAKIEK